MSLKEQVALFPSYGVLYNNLRSLDKSVQNSRTALGWNYSLRGWGTLRCWLLSSKIAARTRAAEVGEDFQGRGPGLCGCNWGGPAEPVQRRGPLRTESGDRRCEGGWRCGESCSARGRTSQRAHPPHSLLQVLLMPGRVLTESIEEDIHVNQEHATP
jgi:hypothetical protein